MKSNIINFCICILAVLSFQATAKFSVGPEFLFLGEQNPALKDDPDLKTIWLKTIGLNVGWEYRASDIIGFKPTASVGTKLVNAEPKEYTGGKIEHYTPLYSKFSLDVNFYVPQVKGLYFYAAPNYLMVDRDVKMTLGNNSRITSEDYQGIGYHAGLAYQFNQHVELGGSFGQSFWEDDIDVLLWNVNLNVMF